MSVKVSIINCGQYDETLVRQAVTRAVDSLGGWSAFVQPGDLVLLKPNMIGPRSPEQAATTHPVVVKAIVQILQELGCTVWIGDSAGGAIGGLAPTAQAFTACGYTQVAAETGALLKNFDAAGTFPVTSKVITFRKGYHLAAPPFEADVVINLPKLKTHSAALYTGALKNLFGLVPGLFKAEFHRQAPTNEEFAKVIADINLNTPVQLTIMDAIVGMEGAGPTAGTPREVGLVLASTDRVALDVIAARLIGLDPQAVPIINIAGQQGLGELAAEKITIVGDYQEQPRLDGYRLPPGRNYNPRLAKFFLNVVVRMLKRRPEVDQASCRRCNICVENCPVQAIDPETRKIDYGTCIECLCCHELCPHSSVALVRRWYR